MAYGTIKVDTITFTDAGVDKSVTISGLVQNPTFSGNITVTGTVSGNTIQGQTVSGATITGGAAVFTTVTGGVATITSGVFALGSASNPSISFTGDANSGLYSPGADQVAISTGALERARIDSSGRLGIGTSTPAAKLHVVTNPALVNQSGSVLFGENTNYGLEIRNVVDGAGFPRVEFRAPIAGNGEMLFFAGGSTERARIDSSGRLLVGTSSASGVNSNTALVLAGNFASFTGLASANDNTATTLFALENLNATYMVTAIITGSANAGAYHAVYIIGSVAANSHSIQALKAGSLLTLSLSGANVQATQSSGVTQTVTWSVTRMANF